MMKVLSVYYFVTSLAVIATIAASQDTKNVVVSAIVSYSFNCFANSTIHCVPQNTNIESLQCKSEASRVVAFGFRQLANMMINKTKIAMVAIEETPHLLPKYNKNNYKSSEINESLLVATPSKLVQGYNDTATVKCNGTWGIEALKIDLEDAECDDSPEVTCSQVHAIFLNTVLSDIVKYLQDAATDNEHIVKENRKMMTKMSSRTIDEEAEDEIDRALAMSSNKFVIMKTIEMAKPLQINSTYFDNVAP